MSLMQEFKTARKIIEEERSLALERYCEETGADFGKVIYTLEGWDEFMKWLEEEPEMTIDSIEEVESKYVPRVRVKFKELNDARGWRSLETTKEALMKKVEELGERCLTKRAKAQYENLK